MFSFRKFGHKVLETLLNRSSPQILEAFYHQKEAKWVSLAVNKNTIRESLLTKELEILTDSDAFSLKIADTKNGLLHQLWQNQQLTYKTTIDHQSPFLDNFNQLVSHLIENEIKHFQLELNKSLSTKDFSSAEISQDEKALEWMRVSFQILEKAIIESLTNPEFLFQTLFFFGKNPKSNAEEIRLIAFNLDIKFVLLENGKLRIQIYNDKDASLGSSKKAALEGDFNFRKREMLDELTNLISVLYQGIKIS